MAKGSYTAGDDTIRAEYSPRPAQPGGTFASVQAKEGRVIRVQLVPRKSGRLSVAGAERLVAELQAAIQAAKRGDPPRPRPKPAPKPRTPTANDERKKRAADAARIAAQRAAADPNGPPVWNPNPERIDTQ